MIKKITVRIISVFLLLLLFLPAAVSQDETLKNPEQYLFPEFSVGIVRMKNGERVVLDLNYNIVTEKLVFMQNKQVFDIVNYSSVDTAFIEGARFIPYGKVFFEVVIIDDNASFFVQHKGSVKNPSRPAAYGGTSEVSSSTYINNMRIAGDVYRKDHKADVEIYESPVLWIEKNDELLIVSGKKSILKIFEDKKSEVRTFMNRNKIDPSDPGQVRELVLFYNGLSR
jgi:hypothetical protein